MFDRKKILDSLKLHEGLRLKVYQDTVGIPTIGYGRNLQKGISQIEAEFMLDNDLEDAIDAAKGLFKNFDFISPARQEVLIEMAFNLGASRLAGFRNMIAAVEAGEWKKAADEMKNSRWAVQVKGRANELAQIMWQG